MNAITLPARRRRRSAFTLLELLVSLSLFATVALAAGKAFQTSVRTTARVETAHTTMAQWDQAVRALRQDAWGAQAVTVDAPASATVRLADGGVAVWDLDDAGVLSRRVTRDGRAVERLQWTNLARSIRFEMSDGDLVVIAQGKGEPAERLHLPVALTLIQEARP